VARKSKRLWPTPAESRSALYIDFEGRKDKPPVLLGRTRRSKVKHSRSVKQVITDESLRPLGEAEGLEVLSLADAVDRILRRAETQGRHIVAWSNHELDIVELYCPEHTDRLRRRYVNARTLMVNWRNSRHGGAKPDTNELQDYLRYLGYEVPESAGPLRAAKSIEILQNALAKGRSVDELTPTQRARWTDLIDHNDHDCAGMRRIFIRAADEMADG
jgi:hypothetical protein